MRLLLLKIKTKIELFYVDISCKLTSHFLYSKLPSEKFSILLVQQEWNQSSIVCKFLIFSLKHQGQFIWKVHLNLPQSFLRTWSLRTPVGNMACHSLCCIFSLLDAVSPSCCWLEKQSKSFSWMLVSEESHRKHRAKVHYKPFCFNPGGPLHYTPLDCKTTGMYSYQ